jgi:bifunctional DNA-binding transcriptional regulator/antitoxin component of YhaV-PrlF toxin-antitoxin module
MFHARLTEQVFAELPPEVRDALELQVGDVIGYQVEHGVVTLRKVHMSDPTDNPFALFTEWADELDTEAFRDL